MSDSEKPKKRRASSKKEKTPETNVDKVEEPSSAPPPSKGTKYLSDGNVYKMRLPWES